MDVETFRAASQLIDLALEEDLGIAGDVTSLTTIPAGRPVRAVVTAKQGGVLAGLPILVGVYARLDERVRFLARANDGDLLSPGDIVCELVGDARPVLAGERISLNFLQHLSGVATLTRAFVEAVMGTGCVILDTRKTLPGYRLLEKYAVRMGGAQNHRAGLYDAILIKDNHIAAAGGVTQAIRAARANPIGHGLPMIVEVANFDQLDEAIALDVDRILLDNMTDPQIAQAVERAAGRVPLEASGNMSLARVKAVAAAGVDYISVGALTHSAPALDLSMRVSLE